MAEANRGSSGMAVFFRCELEVNVADTEYDDDDEENDEDEEEDLEPRLIGHCAIDSGRILFADPSYARNDMSEVGHRPPQQLKFLRTGKDAAVVASTGGDGTFSVFQLMRPDGQVASILVDIDGSWAADE